MLLIAVALVFKANALPYSKIPDGSLQEDGYHYQKANENDNANSFSESNQEATDKLDFPGTGSLAISGSSSDTNEINQLQGLDSGPGQESADVNNEHSGYYYEMKAKNPFLSSESQSGCGPSGCTASASFDLQKGNVNIQAKDQRNQVTASAPANPFLNQASASTSTGSVSFITHHYNIF